MKQFLVGTGIRLFHITANDPSAAIDQLKADIRQAADERNADIGRSLVQALEAGELNFVVFDAERTLALAGEVNGRFQQPAMRNVGEALRCLVPDAVYYTMPSRC